MKAKLYLYSILVLFFHLGIIIASPANAVIRIMPLGDSITRGSSSGELDPDYMVSYRKALWDLLVADGYEVDFVGSQNEGSEVFGDSEHEGHGGWTANAIRDEVYNWLVNEPADIILLHIGTNDISTLQNPADITFEVSQILDEIDQYESDRSVNITVILALIINRSNYICGNASTTTTFNDDVYDMAQARINSGDRIEIVDMECGADIDYRQQPTGDMWDSLHPFETGYEKMADVWFSALLEILPVVDDNCPNDPNKTEPGICGCGVADTDSDIDGTPDCNDNCSSDPNKTQPGICGCGVADIDTDLDGTPNCNDNCPNDPNKTGPGICGCGIPETDSDSDGIPDCNDDCDNLIDTDGDGTSSDGGDTVATGGGGGCFIATAAYGSLMEPHVKILRDFRDRFLLGNTVGKSFVRLYYTYSPPIADFIAKHDSLRAMVRISLLPFLGVSWIALKTGSLSTVALMLLLVSGFIGFVWFRRKHKT